MAPVMADNTRNRMFVSRGRMFHPPDNPLGAPEDRVRGGRRRRKKGELGSEFHPVDVISIRRRFIATQRELALIMGISPETLRNWEKGRRKPCGPSRTLLRLMQAEPEVVAKVLRWHRMREFEEFEH